MVITNQNKTTIFTGSFKQRIQIIDPVSAQGETGGVRTSQNIVLWTLWANVERVGGQRFFSGKNAGGFEGQDFLNETYQFVIRDFEDFYCGTNNLIQYNGDVYNIKIVRNESEDSKRYVIITAERQTKGIPSNGN